MSKKGIWKKLLLAGLCSTVLASCASSKRMGRISPFAEGEGVQQPDPKRTVLWPIYYKNHKQNSLLWPIIDWDDKGFAIRPLYNKENKDHSILFPISGWSTEHDDGWAGLAYWDFYYDSSFGIFPIMHHEDDDFSWYGPYWRDNEGEHGLFPVYGIWEEGWHFLNYINADKGKTQMLFPLAAKWKGGWQALNVIRDEDETYVLPLYYQRDDRQWRLFPLFNIEQNRQKTELEYSFLWPLSQGEFSEKKSWSYFFPLWYGSRHDEDGFFYSPLWQQGQQGNNHWRSLFPLYFGWGNKPAGSSGSSLFPLYYSDSNEKGSLVITPLGGWSTDEERDFNNILGPLYFSYEDKDKEHNAFLFPLYKDYEDKELKKTSLLWPLWAHYDYKKSGLSGTQALPFFSHAEKEDDGYDFYSLLGLYHQGSTKEGNSSRLWPLFSWNNDNEGSDRLYEGYLFTPLMRYEKGEQFSLLGGLLYENKTVTYPQIGIKGTRPGNTLSNNQSALLIWNHSHQQSAQVLLDPVTDVSEKQIAILLNFLWDKIPFGTSMLHSWRSQHPEYNLNLNLPKQTEDPSEKPEAIMAKLGINPLKLSVVELEQALRPKWEINTSTKDKLFPLYSYEGSDTHDEFDLLWFVAEYKRDEEKSRFSILKYIYSRYEDKKSGQTSTDLLLTKWDSGPEESGFSFLGLDSIGYLFSHKKKEDGSTSGHILFIPWGD